jgi:hypothetical protein
MALGTIVGDVLHNLRSALDSIAWRTCRVAGVSAERQKDVYFPISASPASWASLAGSQMPSVSTATLQVFEELQPWFEDEMARKNGIEVDPANAKRLALYRLHEMAKHDRHRVPHPIVARAGQTWLGTPEGVTVSAMRHSPPPWRPGEVVLEWRVDPPDRASDVHPDGEAILAFDDQGALRGQSALDELTQMTAATTQALRRVEVEVLEVVTPAEMADLRELNEAAREAQRAIDSLRGEHHVIDAEYIDKYQSLAQDLDIARSHHSSRWRELFE